MSLREELDKRIGEWTNVLVKTLSSSLQEVFVTARMQLNTLAESEADDDVRELYFDDQQLIILQHQVMGARFRERLESLLSGAERVAGSGQSMELGEFELVDPDIYERTLVLQTLAEKIQQRNYNLMFELSQRLSLSSGGKEISVSEIPGSPHQVIDAFSSALDGVQVSKSSLQLLTGLFERQVLSRLPGLYADLNSSLVEANVLPNLRYEVVKFATVPGHRDEEDAPGLRERAPSDPLLSRIREAILARRAGQLGNMRRSPELLESVLSDPQLRQKSGWPSDLSLTEGGVQATAVLVQAIRKSLVRQQEMMVAVGPADDQVQVIDLVAWVFEELLMERQLPDNAKALFAYLYPALTSMALHDVSIVSVKRHPLWELFDAMVDAAVTWVDDCNPAWGGYPVLRELVTEMVQDPFVDRVVLRQYRSRLDEGLHQLSHHAQILERRAVEAERGRAQLEKVKLKALEVTGRLFGGREITDVCREFIDTLWIDYLSLLILTNQGERLHAAWDQAIRLGQQIGIVGHRAAQGLATPEEVSQLAGQVMQEVGSLMPQHPDILERFIRSLSQGEMPLSVYPKPVSASSPEAGDSGVPELEPGNWMLFDAGSEYPRRGKLAWSDKALGHYLFVDGTGKKTALKSTEELMSELASGSILRLSGSHESFSEHAFMQIARSLGVADQERE